MEDSRLQPPVGVWTVLSSIVGGQALTPPTRHSLGEPLPHQQADRTQAPPEAKLRQAGVLYPSTRCYAPRSGQALILAQTNKGFTLSEIRSIESKGLSGIISDFSELFRSSGQIPTCY